MEDGVLAGMDDGKFWGEAAHEQNPRWETMVSRRGSLYGRSDDIRVFEELIRF